MGDITQQYLASLTETQRYDLDLEHLRYVRNNLLEKTDTLVNQLDRFTTAQNQQILDYRQALRDLPQVNQSKIGKEYIPFPVIPDFVK